LTRDGRCSSTRAVSCSLDGSNNDDRERERERERERKRERDAFARGERRIEQRFN